MHARKIEKQLKYLVITVSDFERVSQQLNGQSQGIVSAMELCGGQLCFVYRRYHEENLISAR